MVNMAPIVTPNLITMRYSDSTIRLFFILQYYCWVICLVESFCETKHGLQAAHTKGENLIQVAEESRNTRGLVAVTVQQNYAAGLR